MIGIRIFSLLTFLLKKQLISVSVKMEKFVITKDFVKKVRRFNLEGRTIEFKIKQLPKDVDPVGWVRDAINQIIQRGTEGLAVGDKVAFNFCSKDFKRGEGWVGFRDVEKLTFDDVWNVISNIYQSNSTGLDTSTFCLGVTSIRMPIGKGRGKKYNTFHEECRMRKGIIVINNTDNLCLPRGLVVAIACMNKDKDQAKVRKDTGKIQTQRALQLCTDAGVVIPEVGSGIFELQQFQKHLDNYKIVVYSYGSKGRDTVFKGSTEGPTLNLLYYEGHYNVITSLTSAFCCGYYCEVCCVPYNTKNDHRCGGTCSACQHSPACPQTLKINCDDCKRSFRGQICYNNHKRAGSMGKKTVCEKIRRCSECYKTVQSGRQHTCGEIYCKICNTHVPSNHLCYIQVDANRPKTKDTLLIFYDLETQQEKILEDGSLLHKPNLCVFKQCCDVCIDTEMEICNKCGPRLQILKHNPINGFIEYILNQRKIFKQVVVVAHNGQAFDHQFIMNHILTKTDLKPEPIMRGTKIVMMTVENIKFLDSLNYFPMALSQLPKAFGLGDGFKKGYFPHLFNTTKNENYVGSLPAIEFYDPDSMKEEDREKFLSWYAEHKNDEFNMQRDLVDYCISDVQILTAACLKFRQQLMETGNVCPFTEACTIASACNKVFRRNFLRPNTIGIIPKRGYRWRDNQSKVAIQWLIWEEHERDINIIHASKQQEALVQGVKVDGFCPDTNQIFEFHGCYYHGCPTCFKHRRDDPLHEDPCDTLNFRSESTVAKTERLRDLGYEVLEMWECEFRRQIKSHKEIEEYTNEHPLLVSIPLNPRDAFYGGRTGNTFEYYKCGPGEKIKYVDVCSLYPWVCKYGKFPVGHPKVFVGDDCPQDITAIEGEIKCKILPPTNLYHPVLPVKMNNKLMFVLCRTCGEQLSQGECVHNEEERAFTGTWVADEILKAIEKGYRLLKIYEVWSYETCRFDRVNKVGGLFTEMMNKFIKVKQHASGWPGNCVTKEEKEKYIDDFLKNEDVQLEFTEIIKNSGLRSFAKLILNSFWGKFGQRENQPKTSIVNDPKEFFNMLVNPSIIVNSVLPVGENTLIVNWEYIEEASNPLTTVNVVIAAYVTTQARLKLYSYLEQLGDKVIYYDTDSVIYVSREGEYNIPTGECIGDMTDELETYGPGSFITEFVSGGPKNYAYKIFSTNNQREEIVCKVKGISLNYAASQLINFQSIKTMVLTPSDPIYITSRNIQRTKEHEVVTRTQTKIYKPNSTKRKFAEDHSSVPYGYKKFKSC